MWEWEKREKSNREKKSFREKWSQNAFQLKVSDTWGKRTWMKIRNNTISRPGFGITGSLAKGVY